MRVLPLFVALSIFVVPVTVDAQTIGFDDVADGTTVADRYASSGVVFSGPGDGPATFGVFGSPASFRNYLVGEHEGTEDKNDTSEFGNGKPAVEIGFRFVQEDAKTPGVTSRVSLVIIYLNRGSRARIRALDVEGLVLTETVVEGVLGAYAIPAELSATGIAAVRVTFERDKGFEDNAGIDDLSFGPVVAPSAQ